MPYASQTVWESRQAFEAWTQSKHCRNAHARRSASRARTWGTPTWSWARPRFSRGADPDCSPPASQTQGADPGDSTSRIDPLRTAGTRAILTAGEPSHSAAIRNAGHDEEQRLPDSPRTPPHGHSRCGRPVSVRRMRPCDEAQRGLKDSRQTPGGSDSTLGLLGCIHPSGPRDAAIKRLAPALMTPTAAVALVLGFAKLGEGHRDGRHRDGNRDRLERPIDDLALAALPEAVAAPPTSRHDAVVHRHYITGRRAVRGT